MHAWSLKDWLEQPALGPAILVLDGGVSTHLENVLRQKDQVFSNRSLWSSSLLLTEKGRRDIVATHEAFYQHGADIGTTVTYQCHFGTVSSCCPVQPQGVMVQMIQNGVQLAQTAAASSADNNSNKYVVASIGCYGAALADGSEYKGNYNISKDQLKDFYRRKVRLLAHGCQHPPDAIALKLFLVGWKLMLSWNYYMNNESPCPVGYRWHVAMTRNWMMGPRWLTCSKWYNNSTLIPNFLRPLVSTAVTVSTFMGWSPSWFPILLILVCFHRAPSLFIPTVEKSGMPRRQHGRKEQGAHNHKSLPMSCYKPLNWSTGSDRVFMCRNSLWVVVVARVQRRLRHCGRLWILFWNERRNHRVHRNNPKLKLLYR